jgi:hypothetical protein
MATACWTFIVSKSPPEKAASQPWSRLRRPPRITLSTTYPQAFVGNFVDFSRLLEGVRQPGRLYRHSRPPPRVINSKRGCLSHPTPQEITQVFTKKNPDWHAVTNQGACLQARPGAPRRALSGGLGYLLVGRITAYCAHSPRRTSTLTGLDLSSLASTLSNSLTLAI